MWQSPKKTAALVPRLRTGTAAASEGKNPEWRGYTSQAMFRARGTHTPSLGTLLSLPDVVRPRGCLPLELRPKAGLPLERAVRGMAPDTHIGKGRAALKIPAQGVLPLDAAISLHPFRSYPSIDHLRGNVTGCPRDESWPLPRHTPVRRKHPIGSRHQSDP